MTTEIQSPQPAPAHTPGPWNRAPIKPRGEPISIPLKSIYCERLGFSIGFVNGHREEEAEANARLIAAAPELLAALIDTLDALECWTGTDVRIEQARAAIAKATGAQA